MSRHEYAPGHDNAECTSIKESMGRAVELKAIADQFPWACYDESGRFIPGVVKACRGLYDVRGFWVMCGNRNCEDEPCETNIVPFGAIPVEREAWHLPDDETPWLSVTDEGKSKMKVPTFPPAFEDSWRSYYGWRKLPLSSPAALKLHWALSFFMCLRELGFVEQAPTLDGKRRSLKVDCIGAARELAVLSSFGELALLLPNTDLEIKMISLEAHTSVKRMRGNYEKYPEFFSYTAPHSLGAGRVRIVFHALTPTYDPLEKPLFTNSSTRPDAVIALLGGIGRYPSEWLPVTTSCIGHGVPFAVTEFCEQSLTATHKLVRMGLQQFAQELHREWLVEPWFRETMERKPEWKVNPFMRPGMTESPPFSNIPYGENAFLYVVQPRREA
ncbi:hypothetical protein AURDEDRAFT_146933 [Auricularia subglabra TFB-10046 SS5]|nr:hypothetical protein AURDEDRAFT_146933 [Auricularia subglabra TFB-10046 SS5]